MPDLYTPQTWHDYPQTDTPLTADRLAHMEAGIDALDSAIQGLSNTYLPLDGGARLASIPRSPRVPGTTVTAFQAGHGWTAGGSPSASNLNDTADSVLGSQAAQFTTNAAGTQTYIDSPTLTALDLSGKDLALLIKVDSAVNLTDLRVIASTDAGFANYFQFGNFMPSEVLANTSFQSAASFIKEGEWQWVTMSWDANVATGAPNRASIVKFRIKATATNGTTGTVHVNALAFVPQSATYANGVCSLTFDDAYASPFTLARPYMDQLGWAGTAFVITDRVGLSGRMTLAQLQQMRDYSGWEIACHASSPSTHDIDGYLGLTTDQVIGDLRAQQAWFYANGLGGAAGFAWPRGLSTKPYEDSARKVVAYGRANVTVTRDTFPPANPMRIRSIGLGAGTSVATVQGYVDKAKASKSWLCLTFHEIKTSGATSSDVLQTTFNSICDYIASAGMTVLPMIDVLKTPR